MRELAIRFAVRICPKRGGCEPYRVAALVSVSWSYEALPFRRSGSCDLVIDAIYESDRPVKDVASEPLAALTGTGYQGGFRYCGPNAAPKLVVLYSTFAEPNWPDTLDEENGVFVYYGDNGKPGFELHDRKSGRGGNQILRQSFELAHAGADGRARAPTLLCLRQR